MLTGYLFVSEWCGIKRNDPLCYPAGGLTLEMVGNARERIALAVANAHVDALHGQLVDPDQICILNVVQLSDLINEDTGETMPFTMLKHGDNMKED